jgi:hypothetical protein
VRSGLNWCGQFEALGLIRNSCSDGSRSRITLVQNPCSRAGTSRQKHQPPGAEFLDAETGRKKPPLKCADAHETKIRELSGRKSRGNVPFDVVRETRGLRRLPPPSHRTGLRLRRERKFPPQRHASKASSSPSRDKSSDAPEATKSRFPRTNCEIACEGPNPKTGWWRCSGTNWRPTTQSSNRSPPPSGTEAT